MKASLLAALSLALLAPSFAQDLDLIPIQPVTPFECSVKTDGISLRSMEAFNRSILCTNLQMTIDFEGLGISPSIIKSSLQKCLCDVSSAQSIDKDIGEVYKKAREHYAWDKLKLSAKARLEQYGLKSFLEDPADPSSLKACPDYSQDANFIENMKSMPEGQTKDIVKLLAAPSTERTALEIKKLMNEKEKNITRPPIFSQKDVDRFVEDWDNKIGHIVDISDPKAKKEAMVKLNAEMKGIVPKSEKEAFMIELFTKPLSPSESEPLLITLIKLTDILHNNPPLGAMLAARMGVDYNRLILSTKKDSKKGFFGLISKTTENAFTKDWDGMIKKALRVKMNAYLEKTCKNDLEAKLTFDPGDKKKPMPLISPEDDIAGSFLGCAHEDELGADGKKKLLALHCSVLQKRLERNPEFRATARKALCPKNKDDEACKLIDLFSSASFITRQGLDETDKVVESTENDKENYKSLNNYISDKYPVSGTKPFASSSSNSTPESESVTTIQTPVALSSTGDKTPAQVKETGATNSNILGSGITASPSNMPQESLSSVVYQNTNVPQVIVTPAPVGLSRDDSALQEEKKTTSASKKKTSKKKDKKKSQKKTKVVQEEVTTESSDAEEAPVVRKESTPLTGFMRASTPATNSTAPLPATLKTPSFQDLKSNPALAPQEAMQRYAEARQFEQGVVVKKDAFSALRDEGVADMSPPETGLMLTAFRTGKISGRDVTHIVLGDEIKDVKTLEETNVFHGPVVIVEDKSKKERYICRAFINDKDGIEKLLPVDASSPKGDLGGYKCTTERAEKAEAKTKAAVLTEVQKKEAQKVLSTNERMYKAFVLERIISGSKK